MENWETSQRILENELCNHPSAQQWVELDECPDDILNIIQRVCQNVWPVKSKTVEKINLILEHSIISSIQAQLLFLMLDYNTCIINSIHACFYRIQCTPLFREMYIEYFTIVSASKKIQKYWTECYWNPSYLVCKNRLLKEFNEYLFEHKKLTLKQSFSKQVCV